MRTPRPKKFPPRPLCPVHKRPMNVNRVIGARQYRYCPVDGCRESIQTYRLLREVVEGEAAPLEEARAE